MAADPKNGQGSKPEQSLQEANTCIALGAGVGLLGAAAATVAGAVCPICVVVAPGLIGYGAYARRKARRKAAVTAADQTPRGRVQ